ncbi:MAG: GNAT family N-acetyltransferase [Mycoplasmatota bacterium]|nr:GNAT family N-acetyltransferase [Mycoplasmatota bacterium]
MRINYLFSGFDKELGFTEEQKNNLLKDIPNNSIITFIATTFNNYEKNNHHLNKTINMFKNIDINFKSIHLIDSRLKEETMKEYLKESNIIFLMGGDSEEQMNKINEYHLASIIKKFPGIILGVSAGSMNQTTNVIYYDEETGERLIKYKGLGFLDINFYPHLDFNNIQSLKEIFEVSNYGKMIALPDESFIKIINNIPEYHGEYYYVENGIIDIPGAPYEEIRHLGTIPLETERLILRRTTTEDFKEFFYLQLNPHLRKYLGSTKLGNDIEKNVKYFDPKKYQDLSYYRWTIETKKEHKLLGSIYLNIHDKKAKTAGIDYWIREDEWNKGYTTEAAKCILKFAFNDIKLNRIESSGSVNNPGTLKVMEKIGLNYEGTRKSTYFYYYGGISDISYYGLTRKEYQEKCK